MEVQEHYRVQISIWCPIFEKLYDYVDSQIAVVAESEPNECTQPEQTYGLKIT